MFSVEVKWIDDAVDDKVVCDEVSVRYDKSSGVATIVMGVDVNGGTKESYYTIKDKGQVATIFDSNGNSIAEIISNA